MTAKEYLMQARYLDQRIEAKIQQMDALNALATKATATLTGMPHNPSPSPSRMADTIAKITDLQEEINADIDALVDLQDDIRLTIKAVPDLEFQTILEKRYLCFQPWEQIAAAMHYEMRWLYQLHGRALDAVRAILDKKLVHMESV